MSVMGGVLTWCCLLGVSLLAPTTLPAGGGQRQQPEIRRRDGSEPFLSGNGYFLRSSPLSSAPIIGTLKVGTPLRVVHCWQSEDGSHWLHVRTQLVHKESFAQTVIRGWLNA